MVILVFHHKGHFVPYGIFGFFRAQNGSDAMLARTGVMAFFIIKDILSLMVFWGLGGEEVEMSKGHRWNGLV